MKKEEFDRIRAKLLKERKLFEDPEFPASRKSLFYSDMNSDLKIVWKRPFDLTKTPRMFIDGPSRWDTIQGAMGDCWFVSALASCSLYPKLIERIIPDNQTFYKDYCGMFYIRFWQFGQWVTIVVDDRLAVNKETGDLIFVQSQRKEEFWSSIVEKAIAKLYGCYENLHGGRPSSGLLDLTGGITEWFRTMNLPADFYHRLLKYRSSNCIMSCGIMSTSKNQTGEEKVEGNLLSRHAYSITDVRIVEFMTRSRDLIRHELLRVKNPWGEVEWNGAWSKKSPHWRNIPERKRISLGLTVDEDGEFWMSWTDFRKNFTDLYICYVEPEMLGIKSDPSIRWESISFLGGWNKVPNSTNILQYAVGNLFIEKIALNRLQYTTIKFSIFPQFKVDLTDPDIQNKTCELVVALLQRSQRYHMQQGVPMYPIGYYVFKLRKQNDKVPQSDSFFASTKPVAFSRMSDSQEITTRFKLLPGSYLIVPVTSPGHSGEFLLRICFEKRGHIWGHVVMGQKSTTDHAALTDYGWNVHTVPKLYAHAPTTAPRTSLTGVYEVENMMDFIHQEPMPGAIPGRHEAVARLMRLESESMRVPKMSPPKMLGVPSIKRSGTSCGAHLRARMPSSELQLIRHPLSKLPEWEKFHEVMMNTKQKERKSPPNPEESEASTLQYEVSGLIFFKDMIRNSR